MHLCPLFQAYVAPRRTTDVKVNVTSFGRVAFSYSAIQPPFDIFTSPGHWATVGNVWVSLGKLFHSRFCV